MESDEDEEEDANEEEAIQAKEVKEAKKEKKKKPVDVSADEDEDEDENVPLSKTVGKILIWIFYVIVAVCSLLLLQYAVVHPKCLTQGACGFWIVVECKNLSF